MAAKSIIDITVNDANFKQFVSLFNSYTTKLGQTPLAWKAVAQGIAQGADHFRDLVRDQAIAIGQARIMEEANKAALKLLQEQETVWQRIGRHGKNITTDFKEMFAFSNLQRIGVLGLLGAGSLWGLEHLASSASDARKSASSLGVSPGEQAAADVNYKRFFSNPGAVLGSIANAQGGPDQFAFAAFGIDPRGKNAAQLQAELLQKLKPIADQNQGQYGFLTQLPHFQALGIGQEDLRIIHDRSQAEINAQATNARRDTNALGLTPQTLKAWDNFNSQLERSGKELEKVLIQGLVPLAPLLESLSKSLVGFIAAITGQATPEPLQAGDTGKSSHGLQGQAPRSHGEAKAFRLFNRMFGINQGEDKASLADRFWPSAGDGPAVKAGAGTATPEMTALATLLQSRVPGLGPVTAFADDYHRGFNSAHNEGRAADFRVNAADAANVTREIRDILRDMHVHAKVINEYANPSRHSTGGHIHVEVVKTPGTDVHITGSQLGPVGG
jgi:hypothetical protein